MANTNNPFGLDPILPGPGSVTNWGFDVRKILKTDSTAIFRGDLVITGASTEAGYVRQYVAGNASQAAGVFWGCEYYSIAGKIPVMRPTWPGTADALADPYPVQLLNGSSMRFLMQTGNSNTTASPATIANIGNTADIGYNSPNGNTTTGRSTAYLDLYTAVASAGTTLPLRILGLASDFLAPGAPGSDAATAYNWVVVGFNFSENRSVTAVA